MKRVLLSLILVAGCLAGASAQVLHKPDRACTQGVQQTIELEPNQYWWGYFTGDEEQGMFGSGKECDYDVAIQIAGDNADVVGKTVKGARVLTWGTPFMYDVAVWLSKSRPASASAADVLTVDVSEDELVEDGYTEVSLPEGYTITDAGLYVGFSFKVAGMGDDDWGGKFPIIVGYDNGVAGGFWYKSNGSAWNDYGNTYGNVALQVLLEGDVALDAVEPQDFPDVVTQLGEPKTVSVTLKNKGTHGITSVDYKLVTDGVEGAEQHVDLLEAYTTFDGYTTIDVEFQPNATTTRASVQLEVTKVNGEENEATGDRRTANGGVITVAESMPRRTIVEEFTGTWCGYCPRGTTALQLLEEKYGDRFVGIAVHSGNDPMAISEYGNIRYYYVPGYPYSLTDRTYSCDPYYGYGSQPFGIDLVVDWQLQQLSEAAVSVQATWTDDTQSAIAVETDVQFGFDSDVAPYALAYVLVADGLKGEGSEWRQTNYFSDDENYRDDPNLSVWVDQPYYISDVVYNHVAVAAYGIDAGLEGSVSAPFSAGQQLKHQFEIDVTGNELVQDKSQLKVVALLLSTQTGQVVNVGEQAVTSGTTGIATAVSSPRAGGEARYTVDGRRVQAPQRGLNIVRRADGSVVKVCVK